MRFSSWGLFIAASVAGLPAAASSSSNLPPGPWRLFQMFEPVPGLQRGVDVWALESDLDRTAKKTATTIAITTLVFNQDEQSGELRKTSYYTSEYNCSTGQSRTVRFRETLNGKTLKEDETAKEWAPIMPHSFGARVLPFICDGTSFGDLKRASSADEALAIERNMDREFNKARAVDEEGANSN